MAIEREEEYGNPLSGGSGAAGWMPLDCLWDPLPLGSQCRRAVDRVWGKATPSHCPQFPWPLSPGSPMASGQQILTHRLHGQGFGQGDRQGGGRPL